MKACVKRVGCMPLGFNNYVADPALDQAVNPSGFYGGQNQAHPFDSYTDAGAFVDAMDRTCPGAQWVIERA